MRSGGRNFYGLAKSGQDESSTSFGPSYVPPPKIQSTIMVPERETRASDDEGRQRSGDRDRKSRKRRREESPEERVEKPKDSETRRRLMKATKQMAKKDPTVAKRNQRMFGGILSHLKRAAKESKVASDLNIKAATLLVSQRESVQQFSETSLMERIAKKRIDKEEKDEVLNWKLYKVQSALLAKKND